MLDWGSLSRHKSKTTPPIPRNDYVYLCVRDGQRVKVSVSERERERERRKVNDPFILLFLTGTEIT
jgi:hypothetical protein